MDQKKTTDGEAPRGKFNCHDWLADIPADHSSCNIVEV